MWKGGVLADLGISGRPMGVNSSGQILGEAAQASGYVGAAIGAAPQQLGCLATGLQCGASGINDDRLIVGWSSTDSFSKSHAAMWVNGVAVDLNDHLDQTSRDAGWRLVTATAINSRGFITGAAYHDITGVQRGYCCRAEGPGLSAWAWVWEAYTPAHGQPTFSDRHPHRRRRHDRSR
jgi:probable HAF family extracellular repeat protein